MEEYTIDLQDDSADLVNMINLHHELNSPALMMEEAYRLLKKMGIFVDLKKEDMHQGATNGDKI